MKIIETIEQGSADWHALRLGKITASRAKDLMCSGRGKNAVSKSLESYIVELASETLTGQSKPFFENAAMRHGTETEPQARAMYEFMTDNEVKEVAFIELNEHVGVSPDGLIGDDGLLEIKCPDSTTQIKRFSSDEYHTDYKAQIQMQLFVSGRDWCDFVSFDPRLPGNAQFLVERVERDEDFIKKLAIRIDAAVAMKLEIIKNVLDESIAA